MAVLCPSFNDIKIYFNTFCIFFLNTFCFEENNTSLKVLYYHDRKYTIIYLTWLFYTCPTDAV